jgi:hypothetical protein
MIGHHGDKNLIVLLPEVKIISVWLEPAYVDNHKDTQQIGRE